MAGLALLLAAGNEKDLFHIPGEDDFRMQIIERTKDRAWPFSVDRGYLMCVYLLGQPTVYFSEEPDEDGEDDETPRTIILSSDPLDLAFVNIGANSLFAPHDGLADLIVKVSPYARLGRTLCDQPRGTVIGPGEL